MYGDANHWLSSYLCTIGYLYTVTVYHNPDVCYGGYPYIP